MPPRVNSEAKRRELVAQAAELFDRSSYRMTSVAELARAVGLQKPTLYHYFSSKDEILFEIHEEYIGPLLDKQRARAGMPPAENLPVVMSDLLELMHTHRGHVRVFFEHYRELSPKDQKKIRKKRDEYYEMVRDIVARGMADGEFRDLDPDLATLAVFGMCMWAYHWYQPGGRATHREVAEFFHDLLLNGLAA